MDSRRYFLDFVTAGMDDWLNDGCIYVLLVIAVVVVVIQIIQGRRRL